MVSATATATAATRKRASAAKPAAPANKATPPARKTARPDTAKPTHPAAVSQDKPAKPRKPKLVRDSYTIPKAEYAALEVLKERATRLARPVRKSELLRAGLMALAALPDAAYLSALGQVPAIKTGRPKLVKD